MLDYVIRSGSVIDGTGAPPVGLISASTEAGSPKSGRSPLLAVPSSTPPGSSSPPGLSIPTPTTTPSSSGTRRPSPSNLHGVTTVIGGNCGFTLAPLKAEDADYIRRMMAKVEGMPLAALETGVPWGWASFGEYLDRLEGNIGRQRRLPGRALRRPPLGDGRRREPRRWPPTRRSPPCARCWPSPWRPAGSASPRRSRATHSDGDGGPITSRYADRREMLAFCRGGGGPRGHDPRVHHQRLPGRVQRRRDRPDDRHERHRATSPQLERAHRRRRRTPTVDAPARGLRPAAAAGGRIVALTMPTLVPMNMSFRNLLRPLPHARLGRRDGTARPRAHGQAGRPRGAGQCSTTRQQPRRPASFRRLADWGNYVIGDTYADANEG